MQTPGAILRRVSANGTQLRKEQLGGCLRHSGACRCREPYCEGGTGRDGGSTGAIGKPGKSCCGTRGADRPKRTGIGCGAVLRRASANGTQLRKEQLGECLRHSGACGRRIDAEAMMKRAGRSSAADRGQWRRETELQVAGGAGYADAGRNTAAQRSGLWRDVCGIRESGRNGRAAGLSGRLAVHGGREKNGAYGAVLLQWRTGGAAALCERLRGISVCRGGRGQVPVRSVRLQTPQNKKGLRRRLSHTGRNPEVRVSVSKYVSAYRSTRQRTEVRVSVPKYASAYFYFRSGYLISTETIKPSMLFPDTV